MEWALPHVQHTLFIWFHQICQEYKTKPVRSAILLILESQSVNLFQCQPTMDKSHPKSPKTLDCQCRFQMQPGPLNIVRHFTLHDCVPYTCKQALQLPLCDLANSRPTEHCNLLSKASLSPGWHIPNLKLFFHGKIFTSTL